MRKRLRRCVWLERSELIRGCVLFDFIEKENRKYRLFILLKYSEGEGGNRKGGEFVEDKRIFEG